MYCILDDRDEWGTPKYKILRVMRTTELTDNQYARLIKTCGSLLEATQWIDQRIN
jgi:hypothetical protein